MKLRLLSFAAVAAAVIVYSLAPAPLAAQSSGPSAAQGSGSLSPDRNEIESVGTARVIFIDYEGPEPRIDSRADIEGVGGALGRALPAGGAALRVGDPARYQVIRVVDSSVKEGLDADILILGSGAQVDSIRNLRWIISGYLAAAWGYVAKDAYTLATFITIYDAVHRGDMKYFASKYKAAVLKELAPETAGLALSYSEWPGKSRIVVPLSAGATAGKLGAVDTGAVSDKAVTESLKAQPDKGIPARQALVDVKEREAAQRQAELDKQKSDLAAAEKKLADEKAKAEADRAALEAAKAAASPPPSATAPGTAPSPSATASTAAPAPGGSAAGSAPTAELSTKEAAVKAEEAQVAAGTAAVAAKKAEVSAGEAAVASKQAEAAAERKDITADQKTVIAAEVAAKGAAAGAGVFLVRVGDDSNHLGQIVFVDPGKGTAIRSSRINTLHLGSIVELADSFVAVSGLEGKQGGVKLVKLDKASLESVAEGKPDMSPDGGAFASGGSIYAIAKDAAGACYVVRFAAADLAERARSKAVVAPYGLLRDASGSVAAQSPGGSFFLLKPDTLEKVKELK